MEDKLELFGNYYMLSSLFITGEIYIKHLRKNGPKNVITQKIL